MKNNKNRELNLKSKLEFEIFKKNGQTTMVFLFVINDPILSASTKILFQLIYGLSASKGHCYFTNEDMMKIAGLTESAVKTGMSELKKKNWLTTEMVATSTGNRRKINVMYHSLRKDCPKADEHKYASVSSRQFVNDKKGKFSNNAIATYIICNKYKQVAMSIKPIFYDGQLKASERIMFQLISSLSVIRGFCYAGNYFFSERMAVSKGTISNYLGILQEEKLIRRSDFDRTRHIYLNFDELRKRYLNGHARKNN